MANPLARDYSKLVLGQDHQPMPVSDSGETHDATVALLGQARSKVCIVSRHLDPKVFDHVDVIEALRRMVINSHRTRIRILVMDINPILSQGHRLIELARRLSGFIEIRIPSDEHQDYNSAFTVVEEQGSLLLSYADRYTGEVNFNNPFEADRLTRQFEAMWETASSHPDLLSLRL